jgi:hypothetical protein
MHSEIDEPEIPSGIAIIGSDDATDEFFMLYFDERGVSRNTMSPSKRMFLRGGEIRPNSLSASPLRFLPMAEQWSA